MDKYIKLVNDKLNDSYSPYSKFPVAALIVTNDEQLIFGVNVENASYGATICAERNALTTFVTQGYKKGDIKYMFITSQLDKITPPCGICRQFMLEFIDNKTQIFLTNTRNDYKITTIDELVPYQFTKNDLE